MNDTAEQLAALVKQKTFDAQNLADIKRMGMDIEVMRQQSKFDWEV
jgi:hypothetical protein